MEWTRMVSAQKKNEAQNTFHPLSPFGSLVYFLNVKNAVPNIDGEEQARRQKRFQGLKQRRSDSPKFQHTPPAPDAFG